jgi:hypothetical protein
MAETNDVTMAPDEENESSDVEIEGEYRKFEKTW